MKKPKIAISMDKSLLNLIDSKVDGSVVRSRSQAIELYLKKGLEEQLITTAVLMIRGDQIQYLLKDIKGKSLIKKQIDVFVKNGIKTLYILTHPNKNSGKVRQELIDSALDVKLVEKDVKGTAKALLSIRNELKQNFIVMSGDTFVDFDMQKMIQKHLVQAKLGTMALMTKGKPSSYGNAIVDGDLIVDYEEKPKSFTTFIVNAGIYIFKPEIFELFEGIASLEKELFPKLSRIHQLVGFFIHGEYVHVGE